MFTVARWQRVVAWIRQKNEDPFPILLKVSRDSTVSATATAIASWLHWDQTAQKKASSSSAVFKLARNKLEANGTLLLQFSLGDDSCRGFSVPHPQVPAIAVNSSYNSAARVFTVFHELAHIARGDQAVCGNPRDDALERWCERVAATILIPERDLRQYLDKWITMGLVSTVKDCQRVANHYRVSTRAAAVRIIQINRAVDGLYDLVDQELETGPSTGGRSQEPQTTPVIRIRELGNEIPRQLLLARDEGYLGEVQVRRYLDVNGEQLSDLANRVLPHAEG
jgi:Zn-dependent peptidase ImmA (M78 family)